MITEHHVYYQIRNLDDVTFYASSDYNEIVERLKVYKNQNKLKLTKVTIVTTEQEAKRG